MKKFSGKSTLLFGAVMALCAFVMPSMASAASWGVIGSAHTIDSANLGFTAPAVPGVGLVSSSCAETQFSSNVASAANLPITAVTFKNCTGSGPNIGHCTATPDATKLPWTATGTTLTNVQIHNIHITVKFETLPGATPPACGLNGQSVTLTGTLTGGAWTSGVHSVDFSSSPGLEVVGPTGTALATVSGTVRDTQQTLTLT
jgi:hypothetical protein